MGSSSFLEIEHKFLVTSAFNRVEFWRRIDVLGPLKKEQIDVKDTYFVLGHDNKRVFRHRFDREIQQLTVKSIEDNPEVRTEINLPIDQSNGDQVETVARFMCELGSIWSAEISKSIEVAYFKDCEIVLYRAVNQNGDVIECVELEAIDVRDVEEGLRVIRTYEEKLGFSEIHREKSSLFELLILKDAPGFVRKLFSN